jgi:hypothetical protein
MGDLFPKEYHELHETTEIVVARIDERTRILVQTVDGNHKEVVAKFASLEQHVNHENEKMDKRITACEETRTQLKTIKYIIIGGFSAVGAIYGIIKLLLFLKVC